MPTAPAPQPATRRARKAATRAAIKAAARRCFEERGYADTSVGDIARAAKVAHGTFYVHFASRDDVLDELLGELQGELVVTLDPALARAAAGDLDAALREAAAVFLDFWAERRAFVACYAERSVHLVQLRDGLHPPLIALIAAWLARASEGDGDFTLPAHGVLGMWLRIGLQHWLGDGTDRAAAIAALARMTSGAVRALLEEVRHA
jgi:AcrR family transcriptional regulator